jgi:hypothetical protein
MVVILTIAYVNLVIKTRKAKIPDKIQTVCKQVFIYEIKVGVFFPLLQHRPGSRGKIHLGWDQYFGYERINAFNALTGYFICWFVTGYD